LKQSNGDKQIRILFVIRWPVGGIRTFMRYVYRNFNPLRYSYTILAPELPELKILLNDLQKYNLSYVPIEKKPSIFTFFRTVIKTIFSHKIDIIHSQGMISGACSIPCAILKRVPLLLTLHDMFLDKQFSGLKGCFTKLAITAFLPLVNTIHFVSQDAQDNLWDHFPMLKIFKKKQVVIPNGIEVERFQQLEIRDLRKEFGLSGNVYLIGFFGRFMSPKGFIYLADALKLLLEKSDLTKRPVVMAFGTGGFIREDKDYIKKNKLEDHILFLPFEQNISSTLKGLDVLAMPSLWEACGLLAMEAMVAGITVIGTDCIGLREVLKKTPNAVVPAGDSVLLAEALAEEMKNPSHLISKEFSKDAALRFDAKKQAVGIEKIIKKLLKRL